MRGDGLLQPRPRIPFDRRGCFHTVEQPLHAFLVDREQQRLLARHVKVDRARRHGGRRGEIAHASRVIAALGKSRCGGIKKGGPPVGQTLGADCSHCSAPAIRGHQSTV